MSKESAAVEIRTELENQSLNGQKNEQERYQLVSVIRYEGKEVGCIESDCYLEAGAKIEVMKKIHISQPHLWSPENPALYEVESILLRQNQEIDRCETEFGIRWFYFSAKTWLLFKRLTL